MTRRSVGNGSAGRAFRCVVAYALMTGGALADQLVAERRGWSGSVRHFMTGAALAKDTDGDGNVDSTLDTALFALTTRDLPPSCSPVAALLYWGGSQRQSADPCTTGADSELTLIAPPGDTVTVVADECYCSDGGSLSYDIWICRSDLTSRIAAGGSGLLGTWTVSDYAGRIADNSTDNASLALLLVYSDAALAPARVVLYDGLMMMQSDSTVLSHGQLRVGNPATGSLTYYTLEGDPGSSTRERVTVGGNPGGLIVLLADSVNPSTNPMNHTINTSRPADTLAIGVDIDTYDIAAGLSSGDEIVTVTYSAGTDKWWLAASVATIGSDAGCLITSLPGDVDMSGAIDLSDALYLVHYVFRDGSAPRPCVANGDVDCNGKVVSSDIVYLANHLLKTGPPPCDICRSSPIPCR